MAKSQETYNKKEKEKKKKKRKEEKAKKKLERKANPVDKGDNITYVDVYGNFSDTPPDPSKRVQVKAEDIEIGVPKREEAEEVDPIRKGVVTFFNDSKGYGFIKDQETQESIFVHINALEEPIVENNLVTFEVEQGQKGLNAVRVKVVR